jgi:hypothetical protein
MSDETTTAQSQLDTIIAKIQSGEATAGDYKEMSRLSRLASVEQKDADAERVAGVRAEYDALIDRRQPILDSHATSVAAAKETYERDLIAAREDRDQTLAIALEVRNDNLGNLDTEIDAMADRLRDMGASVKRARRSNGAPQGRAKVTVSESGDVVWEYGDTRVSVDPTPHNANSLSDAIIVAAQEAMTDWPFSERQVYKRSIKVSLGKLGIK